MTEVFTELSSVRVIDAVRAGKIGVIPTDTIYGLTALANLPESVEHLYQLRARDADKPFIILIGDASDLSQFDVTPSEWQKTQLKRLWPGPVSIILACPSERFRYLHRGTQSLAFRLPADEALRNFLKATGPVVSTSVNPQGFPPATTAATVRVYFGEQLDFIVDSGEREGKPSKIISLLDDAFAELR